MNITRSHCILLSFSAVVSYQSVAELIFALYGAGLTIKTAFLENSKDLYIFSVLKHLVLNFQLLVLILYETLSSEKHRRIKI